MKPNTSTHFSEDVVDSAIDVFQEFINQIRSQRDGLDDEGLKGLSRKLIEVKKVFENSSTHDVLKDLSIPDKKIAALLGLGKEFSQEENYEPLLKIIASGYGADTGLAVIQFLKTDIGFEFANSTSSKSLDKFLRATGQNYEKDALPVLKSFFGGAFGLDLTNDVLKSVKAEEIGCLVTYAISEMANNDVENFRSEHPNATDEEVFEHIIRSAFDADKTFLLVNDLNYQTVEGRVLDEGREEGKTRSSRRADSCIFSQPMPNGKIENVFLCNSTSNNDVSRQGNTFIKNFVAMTKLTKTEFVDGKDNPLFGANVNPIYFLMGLFPDNARGQYVAQRAERNMIKYLRKSKLNKDEKSDLAQMCFIGLLANCNTVDDAVILFLHNPIVAGCDTYDLYEHHLTVKGMVASGDMTGARDLVQKVAIEKVISACNSATQLVLKTDPEDLAKETDSTQQTLDTNVTFKDAIKCIKMTVDKFPKLFNCNESPELKERLLNATISLDDAIIKRSVLVDIGAETEDLRLSAGNFNASSYQETRNENLKVNLSDLISTTHYQSSFYQQFKAPTSLKDIDYVDLANEFTDKLNDSALFKRNTALRIYIESLKDIGQFISDDGKLDKESFHCFLEEMMEDSSKGLKITNMASLSQSLSNTAANLEKMGEQYKELTKIFRATKFLYSPSQGKNESYEKPAKLLSVIKNHLKISTVKDEAGFINNKKPFR